MLGSIKRVGEKYRYRIIGYSLIVGAFLSLLAVLGVPSWDDITKSSMLNSSYTGALGTSLPAVGFWTRRKKSNSRLVCKSILSESTEDEELAVLLNISTTTKRKKNRLREVMVDVTNGAELPLKKFTKRNSHGEIHATVMDDSTRFLPIECYSYITKVSGKKRKKQTLKLPLMKSVFEESASLFFNLVYRGEDDRDLPVENNLIVYNPGFRPINVKVEIDSLGEYKKHIMRRIKGGSAKQINIASLYPEFSGSQGLIQLTASGAFLAHMERKIGDQTILVPAQIATENIGDIIVPADVDVDFWIEIANLLEPESLITDDIDVEIEWWNEGDESPTLIESVNLDAYGTLVYRPKFSTTSVPRPDFLRISTIPAAGSGVAPLIIADGFVAIKSQGKAESASRYDISQVAGAKSFDDHNLIFYRVIQKSLSDSSSGSSSSSSQSSSSLSPVTPTSSDGSFHTVCDEEARACRKVPGEGQMNVRTHRSQTIVILVYVKTDAA